METLTLATEQTTAPVKRTVGRGKHKFIPFPSGTQKALISYDASSFRTKIFTVTEPRTANIQLPLGTDTDKWLDNFTTKNCNFCDKLRNHAEILQEAYAKNANLVDLSLKELEAFLAEKTKEGCLGVHNHLKGSCPAGKDVASGLANLNVAVMKVPALCLVSDYCSKRTSSHFAFDSQQVYSLYAYKDTNNVPSISPYRPANVHSNGNICWGGQPLPHSPRQALAAYWGSGFNTDLAAQKANTLKGTLENYEQLSGSFLAIKGHLLETTLGVNQPCVGVYLSSFKNLLVAVPPKFHVKIGGENLVIAWVLSAEPDKYVLDCRGCLVEMNDLNGRATVKILPSPTKNNEI
jgi:hypothetical protein